MSVTSTPVFPQTPKNYKVQIINSDGQTLKTVATGGANGTKIHGLVIQSSDTSDRDVQIGISRSGTFYPLGTVKATAGAGNSSAVPSVNAFASGQLPGLPLDSDGNPEIMLTDASDTLQVEALVTVTSGKTITVIAIGADF